MSPQGIPKHFLHNLASLIHITFKHKSYIKTTSPQREAVGKTTLIAARYSTILCGYIAGLKDLGVWDLGWYCFGK